MDETENQVETQRKHVLIEAHRLNPLLSFCLAEVQLKPKHQPYKICRQWQELLFRFTSCSVDEIVEGACISVGYCGTRKPPFSHPKKK